MVGFDGRVNITNPSALGAIMKGSHAKVAREFTIPIEVLNEDVFLGPPST